MFRIQNSGREDNEGDDRLISGLFRQSLFIEVYLNPSRYFCARSEEYWEHMFPKQCSPSYIIVSTFHSVSRRP